MPRKVWGGGAVTALSLLLSVALLPDWLKTYLSILFLIATVICVIGFLLSDDQKHTKGKSVNISGQGMSGNVVAAGRDAVQSIQHYHHPQHAEPLGIRADFSALREFKRHRDIGETLLSEIHPGIASDGGEWGKRDQWWAEARIMAERNVFQPFLTIHDLNNFIEPWPSQIDKYEALKRGSLAGQIGTQDDANLYETHWQRLERVRELIGIIESKR